jgi:hypothetical protein
VHVWYYQISYCLHDNTSEQVLEYCGIGNVLAAGDVMISKLGAKCGAMVVDEDEQQT